MGSFAAYKEIGEVDILSIIGIVIGLFFLIQVFCIILYQNSGF